MVVVSGQFPVESSGFEAAAAAYAVRIVVPTTAEKVRVRMGTRYYIIVWPTYALPCTLAICIVITIYKTSVAFENNNADSACHLIREGPQTLLCISHNITCLVRR
jgi:hypothetical protein